MLWIILAVIFIAFTIFAFIMEVTDTWCTAFFVPAVSLITAIVFIIMSIVYLTNIKDCHVNYEKHCYEKQQIEFKGKLISQENGEEVSKWVNTAQNFNKRLFECQTEIKYWGNFWHIRDKRYLDMEPINIEGYIINVPAYKVILENK